jgi:hypothetical protein
MRPSTCTPAWPSCSHSVTAPGPSSASTWRSSTWAWADRSAGDRPSCVPRKSTMRRWFSCSGTPACTCVALAAAAGRGAVSGGRQAGQCGRGGGLERGCRGRSLRPHRRQQRQPQQQRGGQPRGPGQRAGAGAGKAGRRQAAGSGAPDSTRRLHVSGGAGRYSMGVGVGTPSSRRPVSSKVASPTIMCWVATCTLRRARCSGELANTAPPPARV